MSVIYFQISHTDECNNLVSNYINMFHFDLDFTDRCQILQSKVSDIDKQCSFKIATHAYYVFLFLLGYNKIYIFALWFLFHS